MRTPALLPDHGTQGRSIARRLALLALLALGACGSDPAERGDTLPPADSTDTDTSEPDSSAPDVASDTAAPDLTGEVTPGPAVCNDGRRQAGEDCDGTDFGAATCATLGYTGGELGCNAACTFELGRCEGTWTCAPDEAEDDDVQTVAKELTSGRHLRTFCAGDEDWIIIDTPASGRDAVTLYVYDTGREFQLAPEIWGAPDGGTPRFYMNVVSQAPLPGTERVTRYWAWSETMHDPRFGPRPARLYLRVRATGPDASFLYAVAHRTDLSCSEANDCALGERCESGATFTCVPGCGLEFDNPCPDDSVCLDGQCVSAECTRNDECGLGRACRMQVCVDAPCASDMECLAFGLRTCDEQAGRCVDCVAPSDCLFPESATCVDFRCGTACTEDAFAPNQTREAAAVLDLDTSFSAPELMLCGIYAEDWFRFTLDEPSPLRIKVSFSPDEGDIDIGLYRVDEGEPLAVSETYDAPERIIFETASAGTYELWVFFWPRPGTPEPPTRALQPYGLAISTAPIECHNHRDCAADRVCEALLCVPTSCTLDADCAIHGVPCDEALGACVECGDVEDCEAFEGCVDHRCVPTCTDDLHEDNDTRETASPLPPGTHDLILCKERGELEEDWYSVALEADQTFAVTSAQIHGWAGYQGDQVQYPMVEVYRQDGTLIEWADDGSGFPLPKWIAPADETVYIKVVAALTGSTLAGPLAYRLAVGVDPECVPHGPAGSPTEPCAETEVCVDLSCVDGCRVSVDCPEGQFCAGGMCVTLECTGQAECGPDESCAWRACVPAQACDEDFDCTFGRRADFTNARFCDLDAGRCVECLDAGHCAAPATCVEHGCVLDCDDDDLEPNDTLETAAPLGFGVYPDLMLCDVPADPSDPRQRSDDWYVLEVETGDTVVARIEWEADHYDVEVAMFGDAGEIGVVTAAGQDMWQIALHATAAGPIYVRVMRAAAWATTPYSLTLMRVACEEHADCGLGEACVDFQCVATACAEDHECWVHGSTYECDKPAGYCRECKTDDECSPDYLTCREGHCALDCTADAYEPGFPYVGMSPAAVSLPFSGDDLTLCGQFDRDYFGFELAANRTYTMRATPSTHGPEALRLALLAVNDPMDPFGLMPLATSSASGAAQVLTFTTGPQARTLVLEVQWMVLDGALTYDLTIQ